MCIIPYNAIRFVLIYIYIFDKYKLFFDVTCELTQRRFVYSQDEPFTSHLPEALFNMARFLLHAMINEVPVGISKVTRIKPWFQIQINVLVSKEIQR